MKVSLVRGTGQLLVALLVGCSPSVEPAAQLPPTATADSQKSEAGLARKTKAARPKIYDTSADGFEQITAALVTAKQDNKRVLLQFGAEWCGWCHLLHRLFETDERVSEKLKADYVVVPIDVDQDHNKAVDEKYGHPMQHGLPVIVILDADGTQLATQDTAELEEGDHHDPGKVMAFLEKWSPESTSAKPATTKRL